MTTVDDQRSTADPVDPQILRAQVSQVLERLDRGGVAIVPLDVAYAVIARREPGIRRIFAAKRRSYDKPSGMFGDWHLSREVHLMDDDRHAMVRTVIEEDKLPFSVVAPFRRDHPIFEAVDPFVMASSSKADTLDMLLNAGKVHDEIARQVRESSKPVFGSSANTSLAGSKYRFEDIEAEVRGAADIHLDHGRSRYANDQGRSSTIIDFRDFTIIRAGVCFDALVDKFRTRFDVKLKITEGTAR